jgi:divalent metal cation (Fe/Co/Zn/Cd) transporter
MTPTLPAPSAATQRLYRVTFALSLFTIGYNVLEGLLSIYFGWQDGTLALFGFGVDSFIEVVSGLGIAHMVLRVQRNPGSSRDPFERTALRITGYSFYVLTAGLLVSAGVNAWTHHRPETTWVGVIVALVSIVVMSGLVVAKQRAGRQLNSPSILADANCTKVCVYMSVVLLVTSGLYEWTGWPYFDVLGTVGLAYFAFSEGREAVENAASDDLCGCCKA